MFPDLPGDPDVDAFLPADAGFLFRYGYNARIRGLFAAAFPGCVPLTARPAAVPAATARPAAARPAAAADAGGPAVEPARVVRVDRGRIMLAAAGGLRFAPASGDAAGCLAAGDWVLADSARVRAVLPRSALLSRKQAYEQSSGEQLLAANADVVAAVVPLDRRLSANRLERMLVAARNSGAAPLVVLTKADLAGIADDVVDQVTQLARGTDVVTTSAETGDGMDELAVRFRPGQTIVLLGCSGAGKSSLINALAGTHLRSTGTVRAGDGKGRHTTTARELVPLPGGATVLDTPGIRGFALWDAEAGLSAEFADIEGLSSGCRFADCSHRQEPDCAVKDALESGSLDRRRWDSYEKLQRELKHLRSRQRSREGGSARRRDSEEMHRAAREALLARDHRGRSR